MADITQSLTVALCGRKVETLGVRPVHDVYVLKKDLGRVRVQEDARDKAVQPPTVG